MSLALYELAREFREVADALADIDDEQAVRDTLDGYQQPLETKAIHVSQFIRNLESAAEQIKAAEAQMAARRRAYEKRAERVREYLKTNMELAGITEISCPHFKLVVRRNPASVVIVDAEQLPVEYVILPPIPAAVPNKAAIRDAIKAGITVPGAALDESKTRLEIK